MYRILLIVFGLFAAVVGYIFIDTEVGNTQMYLLLFSAGVIAALVGVIPLLFGAKKNIYAIVGTDLMSFGVLFGLAAPIVMYALAIYLFGAAEKADLLFYFMYVLTLPVGLVALLIGYALSRNSKSGSTKK